ncbi:peptidoglycan-binding domain-containing protein [Vibrio aestuarianus]|uniref:peptidoglycan-binding domain-containing protein n=1 Tax=Vibrio aestuarianus TaxID=28171 RepID=UPI003BB5A774
MLDVQNALKMRGYDVGTVDGLMGNRTRDAIKQFQRDQLLEVDGKISPKLLNRLQIR